MADKALTFGNIKIVDDGTELKVKAGSNDMIAFDKATGEITNGLTIKEARCNELKLVTTGTKAIAGRVVLEATALVTVNTEAVSDDSIIILTPQLYGTLPIGTIYVGNIVTGVSFEIRSTTVEPGCYVNWLLINPI